MAKIGIEFYGVREKRNGCAVAVLAAGCICS